MPTYIDELEIDVSTGGSGAGSQRLSEQRFAALVASVARALDERARGSESADHDARIDGRNRPASIGD